MFNRSLMERQPDTRVVDCRCTHCGHESVVTQIGKAAPIVVQCPVCLWYDTLIERTNPGGMR